MVIGWKTKNSCSNCGAPNCETTIYSPAFKEEYVLMKCNKNKEKDIPINIYKQYKKARRINYGRI